MTSRWAIVSTQFIGYHRWDKAPEEVHFLSNLHRHVFHVRVHMEQFHNERDVEYLTLQRKLTARLRENRFEETASCETMAESLLHWLRVEFDMDTVPRRTIVHVSEDGENGAEIAWEP